MLLCKMSALIYKSVKKYKNYEIISHMNFHKINGDFSRFTKVTNNSAQQIQIKDKYKLQANLKLLLFGKGITWYRSCDYI